MKFPHVIKLIVEQDLNVRKDNVLLIQILPLLSLQLVLQMLIAKQMKNVSQEIVRKLLMIVQMLIVNSLLTAYMVNAIEDMTTFAPMLIINWKDIIAQSPEFLAMNQYFIHHYILLFVE